jgi:hypothetical protein
LSATYYNLNSDSGFVLRRFFGDINMSTAIACPPRGAIGNRSSNAPPARESAEYLRNYLREMNARYQQESAKSAETQEAIGVCFYCSAPQYEDLGFCCECGFNLLIENTVPSSLKGFRSCLEDGRSHLYASSFQISRKSFRVQRSARRVTWHIATCLMLLIPYYVICKATLGESFPRVLVESYQTVEVAMENAAANAFQSKNAASFPQI